VNIHQPFNFTNDAKPTKYTNDLTYNVFKQNI